MTKYCPNCYVGIEPEDTVCKNCGTALTPSEPEKQADNPGDAADVFAAMIENTSCDVPDAVQTEELSDGTETSQPEDSADVVVAAMIDKNSCGSAEPEEVMPTQTEAYKSAFENEPELSEPYRPSHDNSPVPKVMGLGEWVLTLFLTCIPIVNLIMLIYWSAANDIDPNKKNFARAQLIIMAIGVVISFMFFGSFIAMILAFGSYYY